MLLEEQPAQQGNQQCEQCRADEQLAAHVGNGGEGFCGGQVDGEHPAGAGDAFVGRQYLNAARIDRDGRAFLSGEKAVDDRELAGGRELFHDPVLVAAGDDDAIAGGHDQIAAGLSIATGIDAVKEAGQAEIDNASNGTDDSTLCVADRGGQTEYRSIQLLADDRLADAGLAVADGIGDHLDLHVIDAPSSALCGNVGDCRAASVIDDDAAVEEGLGERLIFKQPLNAVRQGFQCRCDGLGQSLDGFQSAVDLVVELSGNQRCRGKTVPC